MLAMRALFYVLVTTRASLVHPQDFYPFSRIFTYFPAFSFQALESRAVAAPYIRSCLMYFCKLSRCSVLSRAKGCVLAQIKSNWEMVAGTWSWIRWTWFSERSETAFKQKCGIAPPKSKCGKPFFFNMNSPHHRHAHVLFVTKKMLFRSLVRGRHRTFRTKNRQWNENLKGESTEPKLSLGIELALWGCWNIWISLRKLISVEYWHSKNGELKKTEQVWLLNKQKKRNLFLTQ